MANSKRLDRRAQRLFAGRTHKVEGTITVSMGDGVDPDNKTILAPYKQTVDRVAKLMKQAESEGMLEGYALAQLIVTEMLEPGGKHDREATLLEVLKKLHNTKVGGEDD